MTKYITHTDKSSTTNTPAQRLAHLLTQDGIAPAELVRLLHRYDPGSYSESYKSTMSRILSHKQDIPGSLLLTLENMRGYNSNYIRTGHGTMRLDGKKVPYIDLPLLRAEDQQKRTKACLLPNEEKFREAHRLYGPESIKYAGKWVVEVADNSMGPQLQSGALLLCRPLTGPDYKSLSGLYALCYEAPDGKLWAGVRRIDVEKDRDNSIHIVTDSEKPEEFDLVISHLQWLAKVELIIRSLVS